MENLVIWPISLCGTLLMDLTLPARYAPSPNQQRGACTPHNIAQQLPDVSCPLITPIGLDVSAGWLRSIGWGGGGLCLFV